MDNQHQPSRDSLDLARKHVRALTDGGVSRQALLRALLEQEANNPLPALPSQASPQPQLKSNAPFFRTLSLSQARSPKAPWPGTVNGMCLLYIAPSARVILRFSLIKVQPLAGHAREEDDRPPSSDQLSTSTATSGSRRSYLSSITSLSSRSSTVTQFPGPELPGSRPSSASTRAYWCTS